MSAHVWLCGTPQGQQKFTRPQCCLSPRVTTGARWHLLCLMLRDYDEYELTTFRSCALRITSNNQ